MFGKRYYPTSYFPGRYFPPPPTEGSMAVYIAMWFSMTPTLSGYGNLSSTISCAFSMSATLDNAQEGVGPPAEVHVGNPGPGRPSRIRRRKKTKRREPTPMELLEEALNKARREGRLRPVWAVASSDEGVTWLDEALEATHDLMEQAPEASQRPQESRHAFQAPASAFAPGTSTRRAVVDRILEEALASARQTVSQLSAYDQRQAQAEAEKRRKQEEDDVIALLLLMD